MGSSRRNFAGILDSLGHASPARKPAATASNPACEPLEGRQLLAADMGLGGLGFPGMGPGGGMADVSAAGGGSGHSHAWGTQGASTQGAAGPTQGMTQGAAGSAQAASPGVAAQATPVPTDPGFGGRGGMDAFGGGFGDFGGQGWNAPGAASSQEAPPNFMAPGISGMLGPDFEGRGGMDGFGGGGGPGGAMGGGFGGQGRMVPSQGNDITPGTAPTAAQTQLKTDLDKLRTDMQAIHDKSQVTPALMATVRDDLKAVKGAETSAADATALATLKTDTQAAWANPGGPTATQLAQIRADQDAVSKGQGVSAALISSLDAARQAVQTAANITDADRATLAADRAAVKADSAAIKASAPVAAPMTTPTSAPASTPVAATPMIPASTPTNPAAPGSAAPMAWCATDAPAVATPPMTNASAPALATTTPAVPATAPAAAMTTPAATPAPVASASATPATPATAAPALPVVPATIPIAPAVAAAQALAPPVPAGRAFGHHAFRATQHGGQQAHGGLRGGLGRLLRGGRRV